MASLSVVLFVIIVQVIFMETAQQKELLEELLVEKGKLEQELAGFAKKSGKPGDYDAVFPEHDQDIESNALAVQEMDRRTTLEHELETRLQDVNKAIEKIKMGSYGVCENCSQPIEDKRLKVMPVAVYCVTCSSKFK